MAAPELMLCHVFHMCAWQLKAKHSQGRTRGQHQPTNRGQRKRHQFPSQGVFAQQLQKNNNKNNDLFI